MKTKILFRSVIQALAIGALCAACTNLDVDVKSQYTKLPGGDQSLDAISGAIYAHTTPAGEGWFVANNNCSDVSVCVSLDGGWYDGGYFMRETLHTWTPDGDAGHFGGMWDDAMGGVMACNRVLAQLDDPDGSDAASVRCMRAYFLYFLADNFGAVPLVEKFGETVDKRTPRPEVIKFCESELLAVRDKLTTTVNSTTYGKATRYLADALLAKIYLNWAVYMTEDVTKYEPTMQNPKLNECIAACDDIIQSGNYDLSDDFIKKFMPDNGSNIKDFIFAIPFDHQLMQGNKIMRYWSYRNGHEMFSGITGWRYPSNPGGLMRMNTAYLDKFCLKGDRRNEAVLVGPQNLWSIDGYMTDEPFIKTVTKKEEDELYTGADGDAMVSHRVNFTREIKIREGLPNAIQQLNGGNDLIGREMGARSIKFFPDKNMTASDSHNQSNDVPVFRLADILLMKAEAILRGGKATNGDTPMSLFNQIRSYVNAPLIEAAPTLDELLDERAREFLDEPWRRNDLIRFGKWEDPTPFRTLYAPECYTQKYRRLYPISQNILDTNPGWDQNPGY